MPQPADQAALLGKGARTPEEAYRIACTVLYSPQFQRTHPDFIEAQIRDRARHPVRPRVFSAQFGAMWQPDHSFERLAAVRVPTLVLHGTDDVVIPFENARILARPDSRRALRPVRRLRPSLLSRASGGDRPRRQRAPPPRAGRAPWSAASSEAGSSSRVRRCRRPPIRRLVTSCRRARRRPRARTGTSCAGAVAVAVVSRITVTLITPGILHLGFDLAGDLAGQRRHVACP